MPAPVPAADRSEAAQASPPQRPPSISAAVPEPFGLAITIDDVPWNGPMPGGDTAVRATRRMIEVLAQHRAPVAVFVNCRGGRTSRLVLDEWAAAGATVGNHTTGHLDLHATPLARWEESIRDCDAFLKRTGVRPRYFRYSQLHHGRTSAEGDSAAAAVARQGYRNAPVTIDNSDFLLATPYELAMRAGDTAKRDALTRLMLAHDSVATVHFRDVARAVLGRDVRHVLLLHANTMTADNLDRLLTMLADMGAHFISLDDALADPVYALPDRVRSPAGVSWLYRVGAISTDRMQRGGRVTTPVILYDGNCGFCDGTVKFVLPAAGHRPRRDLACAMALRSASDAEAREEASRA